MTPEEKTIWYNFLKRLPYTVKRQKVIGNYIVENFKDKKVLYVTTETFTNEYIAAIQHRTTDEFRNKYRKIDVLLIDDIQFISRAERTQEEFFNTFNDLHEEGKQIVVTCDRPLTELTVIEDRLRTRLAWGLIADVQAPDYETKVAILNKKASDQDFTVENDILDGSIFGIVEIAVASGD